MESMMTRGVMTAVWLAVGVAGTLAFRWSERAQGTGSAAEV